MRYHPCRLLYLAAFLFTFGCGGGTGGIDTTVTVEVDLSPAALEETRQAMVAIQQQYQGLDRKNQDAANQQMFQYLQSRPDVLDVELEEGCVYGRFKNGMIFSVVNNRGPSQTRKVTLPPSIRSRADEKLGFPSNTRATCINSLGTYFTGAADKIKNLLTSNGYTNVALNAGSLEDMKHVTDEAIVYIDAHGCRFKTKDGTKDWSIWTSTPANTSDNKTFFDTTQEVADLIKSGEIVYALCDNNLVGEEPTVDWHFCITREFVRKRWKIAKNGLVYLSCCNGGTDRAAMMRSQIAAVGAAQVFSWTNTVKDDPANSTALFVFDRLLGTNQADPDENPEQRPFGIDAIFADVFAHNLGSDLSSGAQLKSDSFSSGDLGYFAPTISTMHLNELNHNLTIDGVFGATTSGERKVTVGGTPVQILSWEAKKIVCQVGPDLSGDVVVKIGEIKSNPVPLTLWEGDLRLTQHTVGNGVEINGTMTYHLKIRADVHPYRKEPGKPPVPPQPYDFTIVSTSSAAYSVQGGGPGFTISGSGTSYPPHSLSHQNAEETILGTGRLDVAGKTLRIALLATGKQTTTTPSGSFTSLFDPGLGLLADQIDPASAPPSVFNLTLTDDLHIQAGRREKNIGNDDATVTSTLEWDDIAPQHAPDDKSARSARKATARRR